MTIAINPFHTLYLTEGVGEVHIPSVFSPVLVPHVAPLFLPGNVVLKGMPGTGKTMLLSLLDAGPATLRRGRNQSLEEQCL